jgi:glycosyltransferase involved in cell wall biosynthesis
MKILFTFENPLPNSQADAEVFVTTARYLAAMSTRSWLHVPIARPADRDAIAALAGMPPLGAAAPLRPAALRHLCCGLTLPLRKEFRLADLIYTRNLWVAWLAVRAGRRVAYDHYRPWPAQIPPLQRLLYRLLCHPRFLVHICHSDYTRGKYLDLGIPPGKLVCIHNGFAPERVADAIPVEAAKRRIGVPAERKTVVYTGRVNHKKGLELVIEAAKQLPEMLFILVGSEGEGPIETLASGVANVRMVPWQPADRLAEYVFAADILLIPPSAQPLAEFGSTVLPLKLFFYMAAGRPIIAGDTADVREILKHGENAFLCRPDSPEALLDGIRTLVADARLASTLAAKARLDSRQFTWAGRADRIAATLGTRLQTPCAERGTWGRRQTRTWLVQSWRWLLHLMRTRSWVLPPAA